MTGPSQESEFWSYRFPVGELRGTELTGKVDVTQPHLGLRQLSLGAGSVGGHLLQVSRRTEADARSSAANGDESWPAKVSDSYVRGRDLVVTYEPTAAWPYAPQIYWRAGRQEQVPGVLASVALLVSVQTELLDSCPRIDVASRIEAEEVAHVTATDRDDPPAQPVAGDGPQTLPPPSGPSCLLYRLPGGHVSCAEISPACDFRRVVVQHEKSGSWSARWEFFSDFLEKGVIRRARMEFVFLPREHDARLAAAHCRALETRPLPLTT